MASTYPGALDTIPTTPGGAETLGGSTPTHTELHQIVSDAISATQSALGVNPQGGEATVAARADAIEVALAGKQDSAALGTAAFTDATNYATVAQGATADSALQPDLAENSTFIGNESNVAAAFATGAMGRGILASETREQVKDHLLLRRTLTADLTLHVATTGDDATGDGTPGNPWQTIQYAVNYFEQKVDTASFSVYISCAPGTYTEDIRIGRAVGARALLPPPLIILGDESDPSLVTLQGSSGVGVIFVTGGQIAVRGVTISNTSNGQHLNMSGYGSMIFIRNVIFGGPAITSQHVFIGRGGYFENEGNYTIAASAGAHIRSGGTNLAGGIVRLTGSITITGTPNFSSDFIAARGSAANINVAASFSGSATGRRYSVGRNASIDVNGAGASYLPGNSAGTTDNGGVYA